MRLMLICIFCHIVWSLSLSLQSLQDISGCNSIRRGVVVKVKRLFALKNRPLHSASVMRNKSNGKVVKDKQCEQTHDFSGPQFSC